MRLTIAICVLLVAGAAHAQTPGQAADRTAGRAEIHFAVENPKLEPASYSLDVFEDGTGRYTARYTTSADGVTPFPPVDRPIHIHDPLLSRMFDVARTHQFFAIECEAPHNHVAFTGKKTLAYTGPDGKGSCTFNYSHDSVLNQLAMDLMSVAFTLEEGTLLASEHLHDRLSLDAELEALQNAAQEQRALELGNIAPELESIANDDAVMSRARMRARELLVEPASVH